MDRQTEIASRVAHITGLKHFVCQPDFLAVTRGDGLRGTQMGRTYREANASWVNRTWPNAYCERASPSPAKAL